MTHLVAQFLDLTLRHYIVMMLLNLLLGQLRRKLAGRVETLHDSHCCELVRLARLGYRYELTSSTFYHTSFLAWRLLIDLIITTAELG